MAINKEDIKLYESQRLSDEGDGGGRATGHEVIDGQVNNLFRDISRIDRTVGDVSMRKVFIGVSTDNSDPYLGAHAVLTQAPEDERVGVVLFNTESQIDERDDARNRIESYVVPAVNTNWDFLGDQLVGQRSLLAFQREEHRQPEIGEVYRILNETNGDEQYVRIIKVEGTLETFTYNLNEQSNSSGSNYVDFIRRRLTLGISAPLKVTFPGGVAAPGGPVSQEGGSVSRIQTTQIADASRYYGLQRLSEQAETGALTVKVGSVYGEIVPSARSESPLINQRGVYTARTMRAVSNNNRSVSLSFGLIGGNQSRAYLQTGAVPRTVTLSVSGGTYKDKGNGEFGHTSGSNAFDRITIDYESGQIDAYKTTGSYTSSASASYRPGAVLTGDMVSTEAEITIQNRGFNYTFDLGSKGANPTARDGGSDRIAGAQSGPEPGTLIVSYLALGKWYDIVDAGNGKLEGAGTGTVDYATGAALATLQALPDPDSALIIAYKLQTDDEVTIHQGSVTPGQFEMRHLTEKVGLRPGSISIEYLVGGTIKTITDNGLGALQGDGIGTVYYADGVLSIVPDTFEGVSPDNGTSISLSYEEGAVTNTTISGIPDGAGLLVGTIPGAPLLPGSVSLEWLVEREGGDFEEGTNFDYTLSRTAYDNGNGNWQGKHQRHRRLPDR